MSRRTAPRPPLDVPTGSNIEGRVVVDPRSAGIREVPELGRYDYRAAHCGIKLHAHRGAMEICYLAKGRQLYRVGGEDHQLSGGDVFVTFPDEIHSTGEQPQEKGRLYWIQFMLPRRPRAFLNCGASGARELIQRLQNLPRRHFAGIPHLGRLLDEIIVVLREPASPLRTLRVQNRLVEFLLAVVDLSTVPRSRAISTPIAGLLDFINDHVERPIRLPELAARLHVSVPHLKARFKREVGIPPAEYVLRCKVEAALRRLAGSQRSITQVAFDLGFSSSQYFATVVKRFTGRPPRALRGEPLRRQADA